MKMNKLELEQLEVEGGAASIYLDLSHGEITVCHGSGKQDEVLVNWNTEGKVQEGTWEKVLEAIKKVVEENLVEEKEKENENDSPNEKQTSL